MALDFKKIFKLGFKDKGNDNSYDLILNELKDFRRKEKVKNDKFKSILKFSEDSVPEAPETDMPPDNGDNDADNDYKADDSVPELNFFDSGDLGDSDTGSSGGSDEISTDDSGDSESSTTESKDVSPKEVFFSYNLETYRQLDSDIDSIINDLKIDLKSKEKELKFKNLKDVIDYIYDRLDDYNWTAESINKLTFGNKKNLENYITKKLVFFNNLSDDFDIFSNLGKVYSYHNNTLIAEDKNSMSSIKTKLAIKDGKVVREPVSSDSGLSNKSIIDTLKNKVANKIVEARRSIKKVKLSVNAVHGLLSRRERFAKEAEEEMAEDEDIKDIDSEEIEEIDSELSEQSDAVGESADDLQAVIKELTDAVKELNKAVQSISPSEITKEEDDEIAGLITEGKEVADEGMDTLDDVNNLEEAIEASIKRRFVKSSSKKKADSVKQKFESQNKVRQKTLSFLSRIRSAFDMDESGQVGTQSEQDDVSTQSLIDRANQAVSLDGDLSKFQSTLSDKERKKLFELVASGKVKAVSDNMQESNVNNLSAASNMDSRIKKAKWTELYKDIDETSKVKDDGSGNAMADEIYKGFQSSNSKFNESSREFPKQFGEQYGELESPLGTGIKNPKHAFTNEQKLKIRKAAEIAFEEQFKHLISNPLSVSIVKEFMRNGFTEDKAIESAYNILADSMESSVKTAISRALKYLDMDEVSLLRKAKDVALYRVALDVNGGGDTSDTNVRTATMRKPAIRASGGSGEELVDEIFKSMVK